MSSIDANIGEPAEIRQAKKLAVLSAKITILSIYTYAGKGVYYASSTKGINKKWVQGFSPITEFYAPKYDDNSLNNLNLPDLRSVVHWNPNLETDENGEAKIEYYNADNTGELLIVVEGITKNGKLRYYETSYEVKGK